MPWHVLRTAAGRKQLSDTEDTCYYTVWQKGLVFGGAGFDPRLRYQFSSLNPLLVLSKYGNPFKFITDLNIVRYILVVSDTDSVVK